MSVEGLIKGLVYVQFDDIKGTVVDVWRPESLDEQLRILCGIKAVSLLTGEENHIPLNLYTIPFPSRNLKGMIKFLKWEDVSRRGGLGRSSLILLFNESDDVIFYKARQYLEDVFNDSVDKILELEKQHADLMAIYSQIDELIQKIRYVLRDLKEKEMSKFQSEEFPSVKKFSLEEIDYKFKIVIAGDPRVGKSSTILKFTENAFTRTYLPTLGVNISEKIIKLNGDIIQLVLWDVAGQSKFNQMRVHFYQGSEGILFVFDLTEMKSFENIRNWYQDIQRNTLAREKIIGFLIGNKNDLINDRVISYNQALQLANELNLEYIETSALTGENIQHMFYSISKEIFESIKTQNLI